LTYRGVIIALMECVIGLYKTQCIRTTVFHQGPYRTLGDVEYATAGWVDWYNNRRLHSTLGMMTPVEFEQAHYATLNREPQPVLDRQKTWGGSPCCGGAGYCRRFTIPRHRARCRRRRVQRRVRPVRVQRS
jgi:hypothetical protein